MVEKNRTDSSYTITIIYLCPTCECEKEYKYDKSSKEAYVRTIKEGIFQKRERDKEKRESEEKEKREKEKEKRDKEKERNKWKEEMDENRRRREEQRIRDESQRLQCARNHMPMDMVIIKRMNYDGGVGFNNSVWYQCPECFIKKLKCKDGIYDEINGTAWENKFLSELEEKRKREAEEWQKQKDLLEKEQYENNKRKLEEQNRQEKEKQKKNHEVLKNREEARKTFIVSFIIGLGIYFVASFLQGILLSQFLFTFVASSDNLGGSVLRLIYGPIIFGVLVVVALLEWLGIGKLADEFPLSSVPSALAATISGILSGLLAQCVYTILRFSLVYLSFANVNSQKVDIEKIGNNLILFPLKSDVFGITIFVVAIIIIISIGDFPIKKMHLK